MFCIFCSFAHFCTFSAKCPLEQCFPHITLTWILCQFRWSPQELKIRVVLYLCTLLRAVPICFQVVGSCSVRRSSLEGKWGGIHQLSHEAVGETAGLPQCHSGRWEPGQTHVLHCQLAGMCWCDHDLHSGLPVIVSEQNEPIRPVLLDVLLSHQCLRDWFAVDWSCSGCLLLSLCHNSFYPESISVKSWYHESFEECLFLWLYQGRLTVLW
jgi:hypothetical protein